MYWNDHEPAHFYATYGEFEVLIKITDLSVFAGSFPSRIWAGDGVGFNASIRFTRELGINETKPSFK